MKTSERHHLKDNELALALTHANEWAGQNQRSLTLVVGGIAVLAVAIGGYFVWRNSVDSSARTMLAEAMVVSEARVMPPQPPITPVTSGNTTPPAPAAAVQPPGTYPTEQAKLEAALPEAAGRRRCLSEDRPRADGALPGGRHARRAQAVRRRDRAVRPRRRGRLGLLAQTAQLGKAEAQLRAGRYDAAIASFKQLSDRTDLNVPKEAMLLELARAYRLSGKNEDAKKTLNQIVEQHADSPFVTEAKQELEKLQG